MRRCRWIVLLALLWGSGAAAAGAPTSEADATTVTIPAQAAARGFAAAQRLCTAGQPPLWGRTLCGPMMFVDAADRTAVLNQPAPGAMSDAGVWRVTLPTGLPLANTSVEYAGRRWAMLVWPLSQDRVDRDILLMHESYHRIQPALGLAAGSSLVANGHLDTRKGRVWLRGEMHALRDALRAGDDERRHALADALRMRAYRRALWPQAAEQERTLELTEGLAESTGIAAALRDRDDRIDAAIERIRTAQEQPSFVRSFAYATGPAYAQLLNAKSPDWREAVTPTFDFGIAAAKAYRLDMPTADRHAARQALCRHDGKTILAQENLRAQKTRARNARYQEALIDGHTMTFPLDESSTSFDPRQITHFGDHGSVYAVLTINDVWGELTVDGGTALVSPGFAQVTVPVTRELSGRRLRGEGWSAVLKPAFELSPDPDKPGSYVVVETSRDQQGL